KADKRLRAGSFIRRILVSPAERPRDAARVFVASVVYWVTQCIVLALLVHAMGVELSWVFMIGLISWLLLVAGLSTIVGSAVVSEAMMFVVARMAGVPGAEVVAAAVIFRMALFGAIPILYAITRIWPSKRGKGHPNLPQPESV